MPYYNRFFRSCHITCLPSQQAGLWITVTLVWDIHMWIVSGVFECNSMQCGVFVPVFQMNMLQAAGSAEYG